MGDAQGSKPLAALQALLYGDAGVDEWATGDPAVGEPWTSFDQARSLAHAGQTDEAAAIWERITQMDGLESRNTLQAWHFLRGVGRQPPEEQAATVLGVVIEMPVGSAHDVLAAYADGSARYINHSGSGAVVEAGSLPEVAPAIERWLEVGGSIAPIIGAWTEPSLPPLGVGDARVVMLTPSGVRFGQGPIDALSGDPMAGAFISAATGVFQLIAARVTG